MVSTNSVSEFQVEIDAVTVAIHLQPEQREAVADGCRRVIEGGGLIDGRRAEGSWWYFNEPDLGLLRVEVGTLTEAATPRWEGRIWLAQQPKAISTLR